VGKGPFPAVIVLHHITNEFNATRSMCRELANNGIAALMPMMPYYGERRPADADDRVPYRIDVPTMRQAVMDIRRAHQLLESFPAIDRSRIGLVGLSLGAIIGPLAAGVDGKFNRCVFIMGGGHIADIIWCSPLTEDTRKELETGGVTLESLRAAFKPVESTEYATRIETSSVMMLNMKSDKWVPTEATEALWLALGKPENIHWYSGSHLSIIFRWPDVMDRTIAFIRQ
jgi:dienelactone hydrolase